MQPRATVRELGPDEGARDGLWLGGLYLFALGTLEILRGIATARATANLSGVLMMLASVGRVLVVPIVVLVACETILGRARAHRRGLMLVPLVVVAALGHELAVHGYGLRAFVPEIVGGLLSIALTWRVRGEIEPQQEPA
ncbi:MAG: hypothetical protein K0V04_03025 [Deltaproteobacteria bacterium]|nr:hypothetical protein [Deltaproteobacteria bacterium]